MNLNFESLGWKRRCRLERHGFQPGLNLLLFIEPYIIVYCTVRSLGLTITSLERLFGYGDCKKWD